jgi:thiol-disulfide isomerase/thioredoxin
LKLIRPSAAAAVAGIALAAALGILAISERQSRKDAAAGVVVSAAHARSGLAAFRWHDPPRRLPEAVFGDVTGGTVMLSQFRGRVVLINFWATWCAPCVREMPSLARLQDRLGGPEFTVIAVSEDREGHEVVGPFLSKHGLTGLPVFYDETTAASRALGISGVPTTLLINRRGREVGRIQGAAEWDSPEAVALVRSQIESGEAAREAPPRHREARGKSG